MPYKVWAVGEEVLAADFQDYMQEQVVAVFATAAARDAAITAPNVGQAAYVVGTGLTVYHGAVVGWTPPWNVPWGAYYGGAMAMTGNLAGQTVGAGPVQVPGLVWPTVQPPGNRRLKVYAEVPAIGGGAANGQAYLRITQPIGTMQSQEQVPFPATTSQVKMRCTWFYTTPAGAPVNIAPRVDLVVQSGGGTTVTTQATGTNVGYMAIEDLGPAGGWA